MHHFMMCKQTTRKRKQTHCRQFVSYASIHYLCTMKSIAFKTQFIPDIFFCIIFMPLIIVLGPPAHWFQEWPLFSLTACIYLYLIYFITKRINIPKLILSKRYLKIGVISLLMVASTFLLTLFPLPEVDFITPSMSAYQTRQRDYNVALSLWFMFSLVICYALTLSFINELYERIILQNQAENQRNKAKLAVFKAQISPHFMFNTLNSLYSLIIGTSQKAEDAFIKFSEILKYTYITIEKEYVTIREEIDYIQNYIDLQLIRLDSHTEVIWSYDVDDFSTPVPPILIPTFVENAFKYGASTSHDCKIVISLHLKDGKLAFMTTNNVMKHTDEFRKEVPVGIENCRLRLAGLFPGKYTLESEESDGIFKLSLNIDFT